MATPVSSPLGFPPKALHGLPWHADGDVGSHMGSIPFSDRVSTRISSHESWPWCQLVRRICAISNISTILLFLQEFTPLDSFVSAKSQNCCCELVGCLGVVMLLQPI